MIKPLIILSQPKSGTYLCSEIVKNLGYTQSYLHLSEDDYTRYDPNNIIEGRHNPNKFKIKQPLSVSAALIPPGSFAVGHLSMNKHTVECFNNFTKIVLTRNEQERAESWNNFFNGEIRPKQSFVSGQRKASQVSAWLEVENIFHLDFSHMISKNTEVIDMLQEHILGEVKHNSMEILETSLQAETLTKSNKRRQS